MLSKILQDSFADIKKETSTLIILSSKYLYKQVGNHCSSTVKALAGNLKH